MQRNCRTNGDNFVKFSLGFRLSVLISAYSSLVCLEKPPCWKSDDAVERIIKNAALAADIADDSVSSHDVRKIIHPFLSKRGLMIVTEEVALELNLGHSSTKNHS
jgi:hypothetical protein